MKAINVVIHLLLIVFVSIGSAHASGQQQEKGVKGDLRFKVCISPVNLASPLQHANASIDWFLPDDGSTGKFEIRDIQGTYGTSYSCSTTAKEEIVGTDTLNMRIDILSMSGEKIYSSKLAIDVNVFDVTNDWVMRPVEWPWVMGVNRVDAYTESTALYNIEDEDTVIVYYKER
ncbi:hypothetical protein [Aeromonas veronii]|uniref:hypothetical protein n=1 Tax=Aeromonas veronii TaxID=654 RepID=UPI000DD034B5|nr:hypothetical protein [Aeromonas veronii]